MAIFIFIFTLFTYYFLNYLRYELRQFYAPNDPLVFKLSNFLVLFVNDFIVHSVYGNVCGHYLLVKKQGELKIELDKKNKEVKLNFLKTQINQHFLYNTFNLLYVKTNEFSDELANSILTLSDFLRFSIAEDKQGLNSLSEEISFTKNYIDLIKEKSEFKLLVNFKTEGNLDSFKIPHLCILTLVENAFKHGDLKNESLDISIIATEDKLNVNIKNKKHSAKIEGSTGIGLNNLERRLGLLLENKFSLSTKEEAGFFYTQLIIIK